MATTAVTRRLERLCMIGVRDGEAASARDALRERMLQARPRGDQELQSGERSVVAVREGRNEVAECGHPAPDGVWRAHHSGGRDRSAARSSVVKFSTTTMSPDWSPLPCRAMRKRRPSGDGANICVV